MTVSTTNSTQTFSGGQSVLTFNFSALTAFPQYIQVSVVALTGGTITALSYGTQYSVTVSSTGVGGTVIVTPTYGSNYNYVVYRQTSITQNSNYTNYNTFPATTLMSNLDQLTMIDQEISTNTGLGLSFPIGTSGISSTVPTPTSGGLYLAWNASANALINVTAPTGSTGAQGPTGPSGATTMVSSATTDITITTTSTTAVIQSVNAGTAGTSTIIRTNTSGVLNIFSLVPYIKCTNSQNSGTGGGSSTSGSWQVVTLNTKDSDTSSLATLSSNQITLPFGVYQVRAQVPFYNCGLVQAILTGSTVILRGTSLNITSSADITSSSFINGQITLISSQTLSIQYQCNNSQASSGLGDPCSFGTEIYAQIEFWKIS